MHVAKTILGTPPERKITLHYRVALTKNLLLLTYHTWLKLLLCLLHRPQ